MPSAEDAPRPAATIRPARPADVPALLELIRELATYEKLADQVVARESDLHAALFGPRPAAEAVLADLEGTPGVGFALFFQNFSTFLGRPGLYLEDLYVKPGCRRRGVGKALFAHLARLTVERGYGRFDWSVLDWNVPAISFYRSLGALPLSDWTVFRLTGEDLVRAGR
jgi:ribosomal protein S18 acetylase RimI-like enzyme